MLRHIQKQCKNYKAKLASEDPKQICLVKLRQTQMSSFATKDRNGSSIGLGCFNREETRKALAKMFIVDELSFRFVEKPSFQGFYRAGMPLFDIPSRRTIVRDIMQLYLDEKTFLIKRFRKSKVRVCLTTDTWTSIQNINYKAVIAHYIDDYWQLQKRILSFSQIADHRGDTIGKCIEKVLIDWGIDKVFTIIVNNVSSNNMAILYIKRKLNSWKADVNDGLKEMNDLVVAIRNAVKFVESSPSRFDKFKKCIEHEKIHDNGLVMLDVCTRWNSTYLILVSALKFVKAFERIEEEDGYYQNYFKETENGQNRIEPPHSDASLSVTSNLYFHKWSTINNQLTSMSYEGNSLVHHMASSMKTKFEKYWRSLETTNKLLIIVVVLDPRFKLQYVYYCFKILYGVVNTESMIASIKDTLVELYDCYHVLHGGDDIGGSRFDLSVGFMETVEMQDTIEGKNEVERFLLEPVELKRSSFNVLTWWSVSRKHYPILAFIANDVFAMLISTVALESAFSNRECVLDLFRSSINPKMVECLICAENWLQSKRSTIAVEVARAFAQNDDTSLENLQFNEEAESSK
ncbi:hypothetical protein ACOSP7_014222 [Xanthoceras sorbifolium]